jgi:hypothetical protein
VDTKQKLQVVLLAAAIGFAVVSVLMLLLPKKWPVWLRPIIAALGGGAVMLGVAFTMLD